MNIEDLIIVIVIITILNIWDILFARGSIDMFSDSLQSLLIVGCAQNCGRFLPKVLKNIEDISKNKKVYYVFYENNSNDDTLKQLRNFLKGKDGSIITEKLEHPKRRTPRISYCRNKILRYIYDNGLDKKYQYYMNLDLDNVNENINIPSVNKCLSESNKWDIASVNQQNVYYDLWALRTLHKNNNCWNKDRCLDYSLDDWFPQISTLKGSKKIPTHLEYLPVLSAFGGLTIYKSFLLSNNWYSGFTYDDNDADECEHVNFHKDIMKTNPNTRFYIIPYMTND